MAQAMTTSNFRPLASFSMPSRARALVALLSATDPGISVRFDNGPAAALGKLCRCSRIWFATDYWSVLNLT